MTRTRSGSLAVLLAVALMGSAIAPRPAGAHEAATFARGADISWVDQLRAHGMVFRDAHGHPAPLYRLLAERGINAVRLRVWVQPEQPWSSVGDLVREAREAQAHGMRVMVDFHYSDSWADPGQQHTPRAWRGHDAATLAHDVARFTRHTLERLRDAGVKVSWVQVGNEINSGMLWPLGHTPQFGHLAAFINAGYAAVKQVDPHAVVIVHLANGYDHADFRWFFDHLRAAGGHWDAIGMSLYPDRHNWQRYDRQILANMRRMIDRYHCDVLVSEVGMRWDRAATARRMLTRLIKGSLSLGPHMLGVFYWEPEAPPGWNGYDKGALTPSGRFTQAMDAFNTP